MGFNDHIDQEEVDLKDFLQQLVDMDELDGAALGITKKVITEGVASLSKKQRYVFDKHVLGENSVSECSRCQINVPWTEMLDARDNGGFCGYCVNQLAKIEKE